MQWTMEQLARAMGVPTPPGLNALVRVAGISIDSRTLRAGELFIAIHGPRHDGHTFVASAIASGASAGVVARERWAEYPAEIQARLFAVENTLGTLQELARNYCRWWRQLRPGRRVAAVTGSAGKTTTKEILAALLAPRFRVLKSEGNLNNEYGLPLTLFRLEEDHDAAVVELGMSRRGELARLAEIAEPEIGIITNVESVHLEFFSSVDEIALAKRELIEGLRGNPPVAVLNADDRRVARFADGFQGRVLSFGLSSRALFRPARIEDRGADGWAFNLIAPRGQGRLELPLAGRHNLVNALAALAAASEWEISVEQAKEVFPALRPAVMRGELLRFEDGFTVINDCYNSNPAALESMVELLAGTPGYRRRILAAGEMLELGPTSPALHRESGRYAAVRKIDWIFGVRGEAVEIVRGAVEAGRPPERTQFFSTSEEAGKFLAGFLARGDLVLLKGSRGVHMEKILEIIRAAHSEMKAKTVETLEASRKGQD